MSALALVTLANYMIMCSFFGTICDQPRAAVRAAICLGAVIFVLAGCDYS